MADIGAPKRLLDVRERPVLVPALLDPSIDQPAHEHAERTEHASPTVGAVEEHAAAAG